MSSLHYQLTINELSSEEWLALRFDAGFPRFDRMAADKALANSVAVLGIRLIDEPHVGMLRIIGDRSYSS